MIKWFIADSPVILIRVWNTRLAKNTQNVSRSDASWQEMNMREENVRLPCFRSRCIRIYRCNYSRISFKIRTNTDVGFVVLQSQKTPHYCSNDDNAHAPYQLIVVPNQTRPIHLNTNPIMIRDFIVFFCTFSHFELDHWMCFRLTFLLMGLFKFNGLIWYCLSNVLK